MRFISPEQFAYVAAVTGIMLRDRPAAHIFMGAFYAESLLLAETGFSTGAIQVAGTANVHQLPFFVVACDYTLIGEELYAASAYLSGEPKLVGSLKGADLMKIVIIVVVIVGCMLETMGVHGLTAVDGDAVGANGMKRELPLFITAVIGLFMILSFFVPHQLGERAGGLPPGTARSSWWRSATCSAAPTCCASTSTRIYKRAAGLAVQDRAGRRRCSPRGRSAPSTERARRRS